MNRNKNVYLLCIIVFLQGLVFYNPVATVFRQSRGLSLNSIFILENIFVILMFVFEIPWGYVADRIGYKRTLSISFLLFFISKIIFYNSYCFNDFLWESILCSISISGISGCDSALIYLSIDKNESDKAFSYYTASGTIGLLIAALTYSLIIKYSLELTVFLTIIPYGIAFIVSLFLVEVEMETRSEEKNISLIDTFKSLKKNKYIFIFIIAVALVSESTHSICIFLNQPIYLRSNINIRYFGIITALMQISCLLSSKAYKIKKKVGVKKLYIILISIIIISNILLIYLKNWILVILMIILIEGAFAITQPLSSTIENESIITKNRATLLSAYAMIGDVIAAFSNLAVGQASKISLNSAILTCAILNVLSFILIFIFFFKNNKFIQ